MFLDKIQKLHCLQCKICRDTLALHAHKHIHRTKILHIQMKKSTHALLHTSLGSLLCIDIQISVCLLFCHSERKLNISKHLVERLHKFHILRHILHRLFQRCSLLSIRVKQLLQLAALLRNLFIIFLYLLLISDLLRAQQKAFAQSLLQYLPRMLFLLLARQGKKLFFYYVLCGRLGHRGRFFLSFLHGNLLRRNRGRFHFFIFLRSLLLFWKRLKNLLPLLFLNLRCLLPLCLRV